MNEFTRHQLVKEVTAAGNNVTMLSQLIDESKPTDELLARFRAAIDKFGHLIDQLDGAAAVDDVDLHENSARFARMVSDRCGEDLLTFVIGLYATSLAKRQATYGERLEPLNVEVNDGVVSFDIVTEHGTRVLADLAVRLNTSDVKVARYVPALFATALSGSESTYVDYDRFFSKVTHLANVKREPLHCGCCSRTFKRMTSLAKHCATMEHTSPELSQFTANNNLGED